MVVDIREESIRDLGTQAQISIAFQVAEVLEVGQLDEGLGGLGFRERSIASPYVKDYDAIKDEGPSSWAQRFDISNWGLIGAYADGRRIGGVVIASKTPGLHLLEGRSDLAVIWDIRVAPESRRQGVGSLLFAASESWARRHDARKVKVETQNVNVAACRFYVHQGCALGAIHRFAYPGSPEEVQLLWYKDLV